MNNDADAGCNLASNYRPLWFVSPLRGIDFIDSFLLVCLVCLGLIAPVIESILIGNLT